MSADLSAPTSRTSQSKDEPTATKTRQGLAAGPTATALDRPAAILPPPPVKYDKDGNPKRHSYTSLWRLRSYMLPYLPRFIAMFVFGGLSVGATIVVPLVTRAVIDGPVAHKDNKGLWALGLFAIGLGIVEAILIFGRRWTVAKATLGVEYDIRIDLYAKLQRLPMAFHDRWESGQLLSRMMSDLSTIRRFLGFGLLFLILNTLQIAVVTLILINLYWPLGVVVLVSIVPIVAVCLRVTREYVRLSRKIQDETGDVASTIEEGAHGLRVIKSFGRSAYMFDKFDARSVKLYDTSLKKVRLQSNFWTFLEVIPNATLIVVLALGAVAAGQDKLTLGTLVAFTTLMTSLVGPISMLGMQISQAQESMTASDRLADIFDTENTITDGPAELSQPVRGHLQLDGAGFTFPDSDTPVLSGLSLDIAPGETVALVGATGAGKSILTSLVARLYDVTEGRITIDGTDIRQLKLTELRQVVATAFEDPTLFSMSARENLTLGRPNATEDEIDEAIDVAQAHFVYDLPWGLDTRIGEQGMSLSGGQRQRLALARAVLAKPSVLVLDDTLSALDIHTEALVEQALKRVLVGVTGIVVAHRASTVLLADRVAMLSGGTITHVGSHTELLDTVPEYRELLSADFNPQDEFDLLEEGAHR
ncbi:ABC transporter ATP-binding protein [Microlunatus elymi]|uniref:ABC transporter ATP-binding protein n=1 Tax=Microlunatus elymi TaxID=2596828 RepID=A0A516PTY4_9ACTN|nr:ABC transporter ATP-binding protein [Microlunatus elymi]QDP94647.1 ABC transporter ATP-binding protein [Microlunatus elymi]